MNKKLITILVPVGLIILIAVITVFATRGSRDRSEEESNRLQDSILDYADEQSGRSDGVGSQEGGVSQEYAGIVGVATPKPETDGASPDPIGASSPAPSPLYQNVAFEQDTQLSDMMAYWADNNQKALDDLAFLDHYKAMSYSLRDTNDYYYYGDTDASGIPDGTGIAVYADNRYYYGSWSGGKRDGEGTFLHYHIHEESGNDDIYSLHFYTGAWAADLPDGEGTEHYQYHMHNLKEGIGYNTNLIGSYKAGLYHGAFYITNIYADENIKEWDATAVNGSFQYLTTHRDEEGRGPVQADREDPNNYIWLHPDDNRQQGVLCLIESGKRR